MTLRDAHPQLPPMRPFAYEIDPVFESVARAADEAISEDIEPLLDSEIVWVLS